MGLFSFLIKNRVRDKETPRAPPYAPRLSPKVRVRGTTRYPSPGGQRCSAAYKTCIGGPTLASRNPDHDPSQESLHEEPEVTGSQLSLPTVSEEEEEDPAPAPGIPRVPTEEEEAVTTPTDARPIPKRSSSSLGFRIVRPESAAAASWSRPASRASIVSSSNTAITTTSTLRYSSGVGRVTSLRSDSKPSFKDILDAQAEIRGKPFKDLLDAQSEIRPANFRARVRASGARDYGEDVAERNMGENGFDLASDHVRAFYQTRSGLVPSSQLRAVGEEDGEFEEGAMAKNGSCAVAARRRSLRSLQEMRHSSRSPRYVRARGMRSQSVGSFVPHVLSQGRSSSPVSGFDPAGQLSHRALVADLDKFDFGFPSTHKPAATVLPEVPEAAPSPTVPTSRTARTSVPVDGDAADHMSGTDLDDYDTEHTRVHHYYHHHRPSSALTSRRHNSMGTIRSSSIPPSYTTSPVSPRRPRIVVQTQLSHEETDGAHHCHRHHLPTLAARRAASHTTPTPDSHTTDHSTTCCDFPPPIRTRTRGWSGSSGSPIAPTITSSITTSTTATNASSSISITSSSHHRNGNRPASQHTANTSVDLNIDSGVKDTVGENAATAENDVDRDDDQDDNNDNGDADSFNIDDYLSTDAESLSDFSPTTTDAHNTRPRRPTAAGEEELLLNEAWLVSGDDAGCDGGEECCSKSLAAKRRGIQLPGLMDVLPLPSPSTSPSSTDGAGGRILTMIGVRDAEEERGCCCCCGHHRHHHHHHDGQVVSGMKEMGAASAPAPVGKKTKKTTTTQAARDREAAATAEDAGYEADYVGDEAAHLDDNNNNNNINNHATNNFDSDRVAAAARLRKRIKQARLLAGQPTPAMMRRRTKDCSLNGPSVSEVPAVRVADVA
ncbi:hypothetical protein VTJ49DRAFT_203 [Mycothermus thermophilus]|uniref:Uncharacterized protein n=1 Tax=Humicola insolens TaxID=85995 RepID=A0ABR3VHB9_HUMIN